MGARQRRKAPQRPAWFDAWEALSPVARHGIACGLLLVIAAAFTAPTLFSDRVLQGGDIVQWKAMAESLFAWEAKTGSRPLWATNPFGGMPGFLISYDLAIPQVDDLARMLRTLMWPTSHFLILFAGMYGLLFTLTSDRWSAALSAVAFGLSTYIPVLLLAGHQSKFVALALAPWLFWAFVHAIRKPGLMAALLFAIATALNLRAGHVQITYYAVWGIGIWWLGEAIAMLRAGRSKDLAAATAWLGLGGVIGILMVAQPYLITAEYKQFTIRGSAEGGGGMAWDYAMAWSQGPAELLTLVIANAFGGGSGTYWGPKVFTAGPHYFGSIVAMLAVIAVVTSRQRTVRWIVAAAAVMVFFALGDNLSALNRLFFDYFPLFDSFRVPETWLSMVALLVAVLAGIGLREAVRKAVNKDADRPHDRRVQAIAAGSVAVFALLMLLGPSLLTFEKPDELGQLASQLAAQRPDMSLQDPQVIQLLEQEVARRQDERAELFRGDARRSFAYVLAGALLLVAVRRRRIPGWSAQAAIVLLVAIDLGGVGARYFNGSILMPANEAERPIPAYGFDRFITDRVDEAGGPGHFRALSLEGDPVTTARPAYHYESLGGYHAAKIRRFQEFLDAVLLDPQTRRPTANGLAMTATRYVVSRGPMPGMEAVYSDGATGFSVYENPTALPRAYFVGATETIPDGEARLARLRSAAFDPGSTAVVEETIEVAPLDSTSTAIVSLRLFEPDTITWDVDTDRDRLLVVSEVYYPAGWRAAADGAELDIIPVNHLFRGVVVPAGARELTMVFEPATHRTGILISGAATAVAYGGVLVIFLMGWVRRRRADA